MKGGYQILNLSAITLVEDTETTITDSNILDQLLGLTDFLSKDGLVDKQLKPILIVTKDSAGFVSIINPEANKLLIDGYISGKHIQLNIVYTSSLDDYGNTVYAISSAKYLYNAVLEFENIVDKDGHIRFEEWNGEFTIQEGAHINYCKASLCGTHLLFVIAGTLDDTTVITDGFQFGHFVLPQWIVDKIVVVWGSSNVEYKNIGAYDSSWATQNIGFLLQKISSPSPAINIIKAGGTTLTMTSTKSFRVQFDLLIDNE